MGDSTTGRASGGGSRRPAGGGPLVDPSALVVATFAAANGRDVSSLERDLLAELERDADHAARAAGSDGAAWLVAAMREAVASGSTFVAPKRIREIVTRWAREGAPQAEDTALPVAVPAPAQAVAANVTPQQEQAAASTATAVRLPGGAQGDRVWSAVLRDLAGVLDAGAHQRLLAESRIVRYARGEVLVQVVDAAAAEKLQREFHSLVERHLNQHLRRKVALAFCAAEDDAAGTGSARQAAVDADGAAPTADTPADEGAGAGAGAAPLLVPAREAAAGAQLWQAVLHALDAELTTADRQVLAGAVVLGLSPEAHLLLGAPSSRAAALLGGRYRARVSAALAGLLGQEHPLELVPPRAWRVAAA